MNTAEKINAIEQSDYSLAWDGCHKLYLLEDDERRTSAEETGYTIFPAEEIRELLSVSCGLVFVSNWGLDDDNWDHAWNIDQFDEDLLRILRVN